MVTEVLTDPAKVQHLNDIAKLSPEALAKLAEVARIVTNKPGAEQKLIKNFYLAKIYLVSL